MFFFDLLEVGEETLQRSPKSYVMCSSSSALWWDFSSCRYTVLCIRTAYSVDLLMRLCRFVDEAEKRSIVTFSYFIHVRWQRSDDIGSVVSIF